MPPRWDGEDGVKKKDRLERKLHQLVCVYAVRLTDTRRAIFGDWQAAYTAYIPECWPLLLSNGLAEEPRVVVVDGFVRLLVHPS